MQERNKKRIDKDCILTRVNQPSATKKVYPYKIICDGVVERIKYKFYMGNNKLVQVRIFIDNTDGHRYDVIKYTDGAQNFVAGEDEELEMQMSIPVQHGDVINVEITNNKDEAIDVGVQIEVNYSNFADEILRKVGVK